AGGVLLEVAGVGGPAAYVYEKARKQDLGGSITQGTVRLVWHEAVHSKAGLAVLIAGAIVFALGAMLVARPFVKHWLTLLVAVPLAAVVSMLALGLAVLLVALVLAGIGELLDLDFGSSGWERTSAPAARSDPFDPYGGPSVSGARKRRPQD